MNDNHTVLDDAGNEVAPDPPRVIQTLHAGAGATTVRLPPDGRLDGTMAAVANMGRNGGDADTLSLVDLTQTPPRSVGSVSVASGPEPMKFSPDGRFLAVGAEYGTPLAKTAAFYHDHGVVQVFAVSGATLTPVATAPIGCWTEGIAWSRDGRTLLVQSGRDRIISVFAFDGQRLTAQPDLLPTGGPVAFGVPWP